MLGDDRAHALAHRSEVHGDVGGVGHQPSAGSKIAQEKSRRSLMFTDRDVCCRVTPIRSATDMNRLLKTSSITGSTSVPTDTRAGRASTRCRSQFAAGQHRRLPAGFHDRGGHRFGDDRRTPDALTGYQIRALEHRCPCVEPARCTDTCSSGAACAPEPIGRRSSGDSPRSMASTAMASTTTARSGIVKPKRRWCAAANPCSSVTESACGDGQRGVAADVLEVDVALHLDRPRWHPGRAAHASTRPAACATNSARSASVRSASGISTLRSRSSRVSASAIPTADSTPASGWTTTLTDAQLVGDRAGVLAAGAAETGERVVGDVVPASDRHLLDGVGHVRHRDAAEPVGDRGRRRARHRSPPAGCAPPPRAGPGHAATSSGASRSGPNVTGKISGRTRPRTTLQSVTVSGPPLP